MEELEHIKEENQNLKSTVEQQQKEMDHLKVSGQSAGEM